MQTNYQKVRKEINSVLEVVEKKFTAAGLEFNRSDFRFTKEIDIFRDGQCYMSYNYKRITDLSLMSVYGKVNEEINQIVTDYPNYCALYLKPRLNIGSNFFNVPNNVVLSVSTGQPTVINHNMGEVLVIEIWSKYSESCEAPLRLMSDLGVKNKEKWAGKTRLITINDSDDLETLPQVIAERNLTNLENYVVNANNADIAMDFLFHFGSNAVPRTMVVNKFGRVVFMGYSEDIDLEGVISYLNDEKEEKILDFKRQKAVGGTHLYTPEQNNFELSSYKKASQLLSNFVGNLKKLDYLADYDNFCYRKILYTPSSNNQIKRSLDHIGISFYLKEQEYNNFQAILNECYSLVPKEYFYVKLTKID
jgi:hypothetical protein